MKKIKPVDTNGKSFNDIIRGMDVGQSVVLNGFRVARIPNGWIYATTFFGAVFVPESLPCPSGGVIYSAH